MAEGKKETSPVMVVLSTHRAKRLTRLSGLVPSGTFAAMWGNRGIRFKRIPRLPKALSVSWEAHRPHFEATLRHQEAIPTEAVAMAVSLDGVMAPMKNGQRQARWPTR